VKSRAHKVVSQSSLIEFLKLEMSEGKVRRFL
jgi:hypothetical protein